MKMYFGINKEKTVLVYEDIFYLFRKNLFILRK